MTWRKLSDKEKSEITGNASASKLMIENTSIIKRPVLEKDGKVLSLGFNETTYKELNL